MIKFRLIPIYLSKRNNMPPTFGLNFVSWLQRIRLSARFKLDHIGNCNVITVCNVVWNVGNSILLQLIRTCPFNVTNLHVVTALKIAVLSVLVRVHLSSVNILDVELIVQVALETSAFVSFALWIDQLDHWIGNKSITCFWNFGLQFAFENVISVFVG